MERRGLARIGLEALAVALASLGCYLALGQDVFWKGDGPQFVRALQSGDTFLRAHVLYLPVLHAMHDLLAPLGLCDYRSAVVVSSLGTAVAAGLACLALAVLGLPCRARLLGALLFALTPATVFYATVVEIHGVYLAFAAVAFLAMASLVRKVTAVRVGLLALFTLLATGVHASGALLPAVLLPYFLASRPRQAPRDLLAAGLAAALHAGAVLALGWSAGPTEFLGFHAQVSRWPLIPSVLLFEWLLPLFPLSILGLAGLMRPAARAETIALLLGALPLLVVSWLLVAGDPEVGAYLLPCLLPAAAIAARHMGARVLGLACVVAALGSGLAIHLHGRKATDYVAYATGLRRACDPARATLLVGHPLEISASLVHAPGVELLPLDLVARVPLDAIDAVMVRFDDMVRDRTGRGRQVYLTEAGRAFLGRDFGDAMPAGRAALAHIERHYELEPCEAEGWRAWQLVKR